MNNYLIPANAKKSQLILGFFTPLDLFLFGGGISITILMLMIIHDASFTEMIIILLPALITGLLVMPVPYYHNVLQFITNVVKFYKGCREYKWKGWCIQSGKVE